MKKKAEDISLKKYPYLKKYLEESNQKYNLDSPEDRLILLNCIMKLLTEETEGDIRG